VLAKAREERCWWQKLVAARVGKARARGGVYLFDTMLANQKPLIDLH